MYRGFVIFLRIPLLCYWVCLVSCLIQTSTSQDEPLIQASLPTVTVRGFLNFKTTVDGTVIVFTPASDAHPPATGVNPTKSSSEIFHSSDLSTDELLQKGNLNSQEGIHGAIQDLTPPQNSLGPIKTHVSNLNHLENKVKDTFFPHISDNAVLPSTAEVKNDLDKITRKIQSSQNQYPTGLVTVLGGTHVEGLSTTVFETKVIGTYIDGKYAQILQSTSHIVAPTTSPVTKYSTIERMHSKKIATIALKNSLIGDESSVISLFVELSSSVMSSSTSSVDISPTTSGMEDVITSQTRVAAHDAETLLSVMKSEEQNAESLKLLDSNQIKTSHPALESSFVTPEITVKPETGQPTESLESVKKSHFVRTMSSFVPITSTVIRIHDDENTVLTSNKNVRNSSSRIRFLSPRRPSQSVRLNRFKVKLTLRQDSPDEYNVTMPTEEEDLEEENGAKEEEEMEVVTDNIGLAVDPARVVFQETTITSEVTLHVGRRKSVRTLTITTSIPLTVHPTDIQGILLSESTAMDEDATENGNHIVTRTFTTTERALQTSVVPVYDGKSTAFHTVTESFFIMKIITAYRTFPSDGASILESLLEENSDLAATTLEVAANVQPSVIQSAPTEQEKPTPEIPVQPSMAVPTKPAPQLTNPLLSLGHALSNNPLAAVYLGLQQLNAQITLYSTITDTSSYVTTETVYNTRNIRFYDGRSTRFRRISDPISTRKKTITTTITSVQPYLNTHALQQQQQLQKLIAATQLSPPQPHFSTVTSTYTTVTTTTSLSTRIYTLIYNGFSTKFRTVTSTTLHPTTVTITSTSKVPVTPTQVNLPFAYPYSA